MFKTSLQCDFFWWPWLDDFFLSVQADIMMAIFPNTYKVTKRNHTEEMFWTFVYVFTLDEKKTILNFCVNLAAPWYDIYFGNDDANCLFYFF
jgi:hypothetical protein